VRDESSSLSSEKGFRKESKFFGVTEISGEWCGETKGGKKKGGGCENIEKQKVFCLWVLYHWGKDISFSRRKNTHREQKEGENTPGKKRVHWG